jgi:hypothetical protein
VWDGLESQAKIYDGDQNYHMYLGFQLFGSYLLEDFGEELFDQYVKEIKDLVDEINNKE